jgi:CelD/BcsL family acetyltransferase involved in cellulose biosynthesis
MLQVPGWKLGLTGEVVGREALPAFFTPWEDLCRRSAEDNAYYSPRYAKALLDNVERDKNVRFALVWHEAKLVALLPFTSAEFVIPFRPAGRAWQSKYTFSCMPLLDTHLTLEAAEALLDVLDSIRGGEWILPALNTDGAACKAMTAALERKGLPWVFSGHFQRATLDSSSTFEEHMKQHVCSKRRKDLARNRRRLEQLGKVEHETYSFGEGLDRAVAAFLEIEASGWKGRQRTALACDEQSRRFAVDAFTGEQAKSICRADVLTLNGEPIAVGLIVLAGDTGFSVKCSYNEAYRRYSVGLLLEVEVIRSFLSEKWACRLDSATSGAHVIDSLWPARIEVADLIFSLSLRYPELRLLALQTSDQVRRNVKSEIKRWAEPVMTLMRRGPSYARFNATPSPYITSTESP